MKHKFSGPSLGGFLSSLREFGEEKMPEKPQAFPPQAQSTSVHGPGETAEHGGADGASVGALHPP